MNLGLFVQCKLHLIILKSLLHAPDLDLADRENIYCPFLISMLKIGDDVLKITVDLCKLQCPRVLKLEHFSNLLQQYIIELQCVSDKLKVVRNDISGTRNLEENVFDINPEGDQNSTVTDHEQILNKSIDIRTKALQNEAQNKSEGLDETNIQTGTDLVQIKASKDEIERRISAFIERKQAEINENNIREFCNVINCNLENSCARTDAIFTPHPGFKSHIKGGPVPIGVYQRIKKLEDRILHLEGLSPEYFQHVNFPRKRRKVQETVQGYSLIEIDEKINALKEVLLKKAGDQAQLIEENKMSI
ncbi:MAP3K12-binding inhibitory protein 1 isoform X4 [Narcine bancroftii]|uniref:MAP3K12-binding inhibitory protein 1 isoform X4 n=1 Tax=Narcine bancroftii TaxID=1343680 RepID=UPI003831BCBF